MSIPWFLVESKWHIGHKKRCDKQNSYIIFFFNLIYLLLKSLSIRVDYFHRIILFIKTTSFPSLNRCKTQMLRDHERYGVTLWNDISTSPIPRPWSTAVPRTENVNNFPTATKSTVIPQLNNLKGNREKGRRRDSRKSLFFKAFKRRSRSVLVKGLKWEIRRVDILILVSSLKWNCTPCAKENLDIFVDQYFNMIPESMLTCGWFYEENHCTKTIGYPPLLLIGMNKCCCIFRYFYWKLLWCFWPFG